MKNKFKGMITVEKASKNEKRKIIKEKKRNKRTEAGRKIENKENELIIQNICDNAENDAGSDNNNIVEKTSPAFDKTKGLFMVFTPNRYFWAWDKFEITSNLTAEENTYEVSYIEYVGYYAGKTDVICITKGEKREYQTFNDVDSMFVYQLDASLKKWLCHLKPFNTCEEIYEQFKKKGLKLRNDIFYREKKYREAVNKLR